MANRREAEGKVYDDFQVPVLATYEDKDRVEVCLGQQVICRLDFLWDPQGNISTGHLDIYDTMCGKQEENESKDRLPQYKKLHLCLGSWLSG